MSDPFRPQLDVNLRVTWHFLGSFYELEFLCWLRGTPAQSKVLFVRPVDSVGPDFHQGNRPLLAEERVLAEEDVVALLENMEQAGLLDRELQIESMPALEEDWGARVTLSMQVDDRRQDLHMSIVYLGIQGADAELVRSFLQKVLAMTDTKSGWIWDLLTSANGPGLSRAKPASSN